MKQLLFILFFVVNTVCLFGQKEYQAITFANGDRYEGYWLYEDKHGQGTYIYNNGSKYIGEWQKDNYHGEGVLYNEQGKKVYEGEFENGMAHGQGILYDKYGSIYYKGMWKNNRKHGKGKILTQNLNMYEGNFENNNISGYGALKLNSGARYIGYFKNNAYNGQGTFYWSDGSTKAVGTWENGNGYNLAYYNHNGYVCRINMINGKASLTNAEKRSRSQASFSDLEIMIGTLAIVGVATAIFSENKSEPATNNYSANYSSNSTRNKVNNSIDCNTFASIEFSASQTCIIKSHLSIHRAGSDISVNEGVYHNATVADNTCIKGEYSFSWTFYSQCINLGNPDGPYTYSGKFNLDGKHSHYLVFISSDGYVEVSGH